MAFPANKKILIFTLFLFFRRLKALGVFEPLEIFINSDRKTNPTPKTSYFALTIHDSVLKGQDLFSETDRGIYF